MGRGRGGIWVPEYFSHSEIKNWMGRKKWNPAPETIGSLLNYLEKITFFPFYGLSLHIKSANNQDDG